MFGVVKPHYYEHPAKSPYKDRAMKLIDKNVDHPENRTKVINQIIEWGVNKNTARTWYYTRIRDLKEGKA